MDASSPTWKPLPLEVLTRSSRALRLRISSILYKMPRFVINHPQSLF
jgi:hypothetical protein